MTSPRNFGKGEVVRVYTSNTVSRLTSSDRRMEIEKEPADDRSSRLKKHASLTLYCVF
jgi:hypothetical protein